MAKKGESKQPLKPEELGGLYPTPKTSDEKQAETEARQEYYDTLRTRLAAFKIAFFGSLLLPVIIYYALNVESLWLVGSMPIIVGSYLMWVILGLFAIKWIRYTANIFYEYSSSMGGFWVIYLIVMSVAVFAWQRGLWFPTNSYYWIGLLAAVQLVSTYIGAKLFIKRR